MALFDVDTIVFDLDGTLIDSRLDIANSLNQTFKDVGYDPLPLSVIEKFVGNGIVPLVRNAVEEAGHPEKEGTVLEIFREHYWNHLLDETKMFTGVMETLELLNGRYGMGLVSNKPERFTKKIIEDLGLIPMFGDDVYGGDTLPVKKPDPAALLEIAKSQNTSASRLLMVGDGAVDVLAGKNAGAYTVGVTYGFRDVEEIREAKVDKIIDRFDELLGLLA